jgi:glutathione S-transferase
MKLISAAASPFVRKVRVLILETGQEADVELDMITVSPVAPNTDLNAANPLGKIPALIRDDGPAIYDSRVICRYLDARAKANLYPETRLWETLTLEATADAMMEAAVLMTYEGRLRKPEQQSAVWVEAQWQKIARTLSALETRWMSHLHGHLTASQIGVGCALAYIDFRHETRNWRQGHDTLTAWEAEFAQRPSMQATQPE